MRLHWPARFALALALALLAVVTLPACGGGASASAPSTLPAPSSPPTQAAPATSAPATATLERDHEAAYTRATSAALRGDIAAAVAELEPFARATAARTDLELAYWVHNQLTWLRWGQGDVRGALAETDLGARALDRSALPANDVASMRLHALWDRAYLLLELGDRAADAAFTDYETLAKARDDHDGLAVLTAFFAARHKDAEAAMKAAARVDVEKDSDLQDLYVIALAFAAGGDTSRARICKGNEYLMKPLPARDAVGDAEQPRTNGPTRVVILE